jgi:hypothetical protein
MHRSLMSSFEIQRAGGPQIMELGGKPRLFKHLLYNNDIIRRRHEAPTDPEDIDTVNM